MSETPTSQAESGWPPGGVAAYQPRPFGYLGTWNEGAWALKTYGIHHRRPTGDQPLIDPAVADAARAQVRALLPRADEEGGHYQTGFVVLHQGLQGNWLLLQWWAHEDICCQILSRSDASAPEAFEVVTRPLMACVWELLVIDFERRAWIETALGAAPDRQAYLDRRLADGMY